MGSSYRIKDWTKYQHYQTGRNAQTLPGWIKLYRRDTLDNVHFHRLSDGEARTLLLLWLLASETGGELPGIAQMAYRLQISEEALGAALPKLSQWVEEVPRTVLGCPSTDKNRLEEIRGEEIRGEQIRGEESTRGEEYTAPPSGSPDVGDEFLEQEGQPGRPPECHSINGLDGYQEEEEDYRLATPWMRRAR